MMLKRITSFFVAFVLVANVLFAHPAELIIANNSDELTYEVTLKVGGQIYRADIIPRTRKALRDIVTDMAYDEVPNYFGLIVRCFYQGKLYKHDRKFIEKNSFVSFRNPSTADFDRRFIKTEVEYSFPYSYLTPLGEVVEKDTAYPNYQVYFNDVELMPGMKTEVKDLVVDLYAKVFLSLNLSDFDRFIEEFYDEKIACAFPSLLENGFIRKGHFLALMEILKADSSPIKARIKELKEDNVAEFPTCPGCGQRHPCVRIIVTPFL